MPQELTNEQIQNYKIIEAKIEYYLAEQGGNVQGMQAAHIKGENARSAGGTIPTGQALTQEMIDAYQAYKEAGGGGMLASLTSMKIFGIPVVYLLGGAGLLLFLKRK